MLMSFDHVSVWDRCLTTIQKQVNAQAFETWFAPIQPIKLDGKALTIQVPNKFFYEWLEEHFINVLKNTIRQELGDGARLEYMIPRKAQPDAESRPSNIGQKPPQTPKPIQPDEIKNPFVIPGIKRPKIEPNLKANYVFDSFVEGDCNRLARAAGLAVAKKPGETSFNPLFIFGATGLGKTHLAHAIGNEVVKKFDNKTVLYISAEQFTNQFIESVQNNAVNDFTNFHYLIDVLIIDDIHHFANKHKTQDIFFHIFNQLHQNGKQIILTSDRPPKELEGIEDRLISRFKWGLSADLQSPDLETRMAIIQKKMVEEGIDIPYNVTEFISYNIKSNVRELEGVVVSLLAQAALNNRDVDIDLARDVIKHFVESISKEITLEFIQRIVAEHFQVTVDKLKAKTRQRVFVMARQLSMFLAKNLTNHSLKAIGEYFGGRDHSTVIYSCKTVQDLLDTDSDFREQVNSLEKKIKISAG